MRRALAVPVLLAVALLPAASVFASHAQTVDGKSVSFAHKGGNEWWVEVRLGGASAAQVAAVEAMDTGGSWKPLTLRSWGNWGGSFHLEEGHDVRFRARFGDGAVVESCWFTHPEGVETCEADPTPPAEGSFPASYRPGGNEWWVQVKVAADRPLAGVDARVDAGAWVALELKSWGDWAKSLRAPDGSIVEFRARAADGRVNHSGGYRWPDATPVDGGGTPPPGGFDATFRPKGNEWWVEVRVEGNEPIAGVDARIEGEEWRALSKRSWGAWAASFHVPNGAKVTFTATSTSNQVVTSDSYKWPVY